MIKIRLARHGRKQLPFYWFVAANSKCPRDGRFLEKLGTYNPKILDSKLSINGERVAYWLSCGAQTTDRTKRLIHQEMEKNEEFRVRMSTFSVIKEKDYIKKERVSKKKN